MEIFKIGHLSFSYPDQESNALDDISFSVNSGEFFTICGLSGCGKTTLLRHLKSSLSPHGTSSGSILFNGKPLGETDELTQASQIGFVMQSPENQSVTDKVWHELAFGLENLGIQTPVIRRKVAETAVFFGLTDKLYSKICELSGGQKQILNLASVMIQEPSVLILDEPTAQLDPVASEAFLMLLRKIHDEFGTAIILCEHTLENICSMTDRFIIIDKGRMIFEGTPRETALYLFKTNNPLLESMPVSARIMSAFAVKPEKVKMTIGEGKRFLKDYSEKTALCPITHDYSIHKENEKPIVTLKNVFFRYGKNTPDVLKGLSLSAWRGEILAVNGGNGSGKTTLLNVIAGISKTYSGLTSVGTQKENIRICLLPQDPKTLFLKDSVEDDLYSVDDFEHDKTFSGNVERIIEFCGLSKLKKHHPYDLSGGEQQMAALAKVLLRRPDVLLLDEPVKGIDVKAKSETGAILRSIANEGVCIIMVSHDTEFCAEYADRCALLFDGDIVSTSVPDSFFSDNTFFTTPAARMAKGVIPNAVTADDIRKTLSLPISKKENKRFPSDFFRTEKIPETDHSKKRKAIPIKAMLTAAFVLFVLFFAVFKQPLGIDIPHSDLIINASVIVFLIGALFFGVPDNKKTENVLIHPVKRSAKQRVAEILLIFLTIPLTIFIGVYFFGDAKYLFISLLIMLECMLPFFAVFEKRHIKTRELVLIAVMCSMAVAVRTAFYMFPQFKPITAVIIIAGASLGAESGFLIGSLSMLISNILFGQGPWTPWQMFGMGLIGFLSGLIFGSDLIPKNKYSFSVFGFLAAPLLYGLIMNPAALILSHSELSYKNLIAYYAAGLPLDIVHGIATAVFLFWAAVPVIKKIERVKLKYGLV